MNTAQIIRAIVKSGERFYGIPCEVISVDDNARTCNVKPCNGDANISNVRLQCDLNGAVGLYIKPKVGSNVIIGFENKNAGYLILCSEIERFELVCDNIIFNGGNNNGLVNVTPLKTGLKKLNDQLQAVITSLESWSPVPNDGGAALKAYFSSQISGKQQGDFSQIEDTKIKH